MKNLWSLTVDEALAADEIKNRFKKTDYEIFFPVNTQMKDIDLIMLDLKRNKVKSIQVKGSRTYPPRKSQIEQYGNGSAAWITIGKSSIFEPSNRVDWFVFVLHSFVDGEERKEIVVDYLIVPAEDLRKIASGKKIRKGDKYHFFIWVDSKGRRAFDYNDSKSIPLSKYLNSWEALRLS